MQVPTIKIKREGGRGFRLINAFDFDAAIHEPADDEAKAYVAYMEKHGKPELPTEAPWGGVAVNPRKNTDGTFSEPTPMDVRYSNKNRTEFASNHANGKSAAEIRKELGMPDAPVGIVGIIEIPLNWRKMTHEEIIALAERISGHSNLSIKESKMILRDEGRLRANTLKTMRDGLTPEERENLEWQQEPVEEVTEDFDWGSLKTHKHLDAFAEDHNIEVPDGWHTLKISEKQEWLSQNSG